MKLFALIGLGSLLWSTTGCICFPKPPARKVGQVLMPYLYELSKNGAGDGQIRVVLDESSPPCTTYWRVGDTDGPRTKWSRVRREKNSFSRTVPATVYLLQFRAPNDVAPENRTVTVQEKQRLTVTIGYR